MLWDFRSVSFKMGDNFINVIVNQEDVNVDRAVRWVADKSCGAIVNFLGFTREDSKADNSGLKTKFLIYDCFHEMALKELHRLCQLSMTKYAIR